MAEIAKFLFDRRFDRPLEADEAWGGARAPEPEPEAAPEPEEPPPPPPPLFTSAQMEAAREEGYIAGHAAALDEAAAASERMTALALGEVAVGLEALQGRHAATRSDLARDAARLVLAICRKVLPVSATETVVREITALVNEALPQILDEPRLVVRVHPDVADPIRARLDPLCVEYGYEGRLLVNGDPRLGRPDCRVEWAEGGMERDTQRQWAEIDEIVARHTGLPPPPQAPAPALDASTSASAFAPDADADAAPSVPPVSGP